MSGHDRFRYASIAAVLVCYGTILLGGNVMASDSGLACPDWPTCHGSLLPPLAGPTGVEYAHRISAFLLAVSVLFLSALGIAYERERPVILRLALGSLGLVVAQALLGAVVVFSGLAVGTVLLHLGLATALFGVLLLLALLANMADIPPRWIDWARRASRPAERTPSDLRGVPGPERHPSSLPSPAESFP